MARCASASILYPPNNSDSAIFGANDHVDMVGSAVAGSEVPTTECARFRNRILNNPSQSRIETYRCTGNDPRFVAVSGIAHFEQWFPKSVVVAVDGAPLVAMQPIAIGRQRDKQTQMALAHHKSMSEARPGGLARPAWENANDSAPTSIRTHSPSVSARKSSARCLADATAFAFARQASAPALASDIDPFCYAPPASEVPHVRRDPLRGR